MQAVHLCQVWSTSTDRCLKAPNVDVLSILFYAERQCLITSCGNGLNSKMVLLIVPMYIFSWSSAPVPPLIFGLRHLSAVDLRKKEARGGCSGFLSACQLTVHRIPADASIVCWSPRESTTARNPLIGYTHTCDMNSLRRS